jgi:hypothetical protein
MPEPPVEVSTRVSLTPHPLEPSGAPFCHADEYDKRNSRYVIRRSLR